MTSYNEPDISKFFSYQGLASRLHLIILIHTVWCALRWTVHTWHICTHGIPPPFQSYRGTRLSWAAQDAHWSRKQNKTLYFNQKMFYLHRPNGYKYTCKYRWRGRASFFRSQCGCGRYVVYAAISAKRKTELALNTKTLTSRAYETILKDFCSFHNVSKNEISFYSKHCTHIM